MDDRSRPRNEADSQVKSETPSREPAARFPNARILFVLAVGLLCVSGQYYSMINADTTQSIVATPASILPGQSTTISWSSQGMESCVVSGPGIATSSVLGSMSTGPLASSAIYTITCLQPVTQTVTVSVSVPTPILAITLNGTTSAVVTTGATATLQWSASNVGEGSCRVTSPQDPNVHTNESGTVSIGPLTATRTYSINCLKLDGTPAPAQSATVTVQSFSCAPKTLSAENQGLVAKFDAYDQAFNNGMGYSQYDNSAGVLAQSEAEYVKAYTVMFEATNNEKYIQKAIQRSDMMLAKRDDKLGVKNWRGSIAKVWSRGGTSGATTGPYPHLVENGLITSPIAATAALIKKTPCLQTLQTPDGRNFVAVANTYITEVNETFKFYNPVWHTDTIEGSPIGFWTTEGDVTFASFTLPANQPPPINYQTAMGETYAAMYGATGNTSYRDQAQRLANMLFKDFGYTEKDDSYWWNYWPWMWYYPSWYTRDDSTPEDFGHAAYTYRFAEAMIKHGLGRFDSSIMTRMAHTFTRTLYQPSKGGFVFGLDGTGNEVTQSLNGTAPYYAGQYAFLKQWDSAVLPAVRFGLFTQKKMDTVASGQWPHGMLSLASYILYNQ